MKTNLFVSLLKNQPRKDLRSNKNKNVLIALIRVKFLWPLCSGPVTELLRGGKKKFSEGDGRQKFCRRGKKKKERAKGANFFALH